jgi:hypothetical protein
MVSALAACGVKPKNVKPPEGAQGVYPSVYPYPDEDMIAANKAQAEANAAIKAAKEKEKNAALPGQTTGSGQ